MVMANETSDIWLEAGLQLLTEHGRQGLTVERLCRATGKTKGSFYHHFSGTPEFLRRLLEKWQKDHTQDLIAMTERLPPEAALGRLQSLARNLPVERETAFRSWAAQDPEVARLVAEVDGKRAEHLSRVHQAMGCSPTQAETRAWLDYATFLGLAQLRGSLSREQLGSLRRHLEGRPYDR